MSRTLSAPLVTHVAGTAHTRCRMLLLILRDGALVGITDHDQDITFTLPEVGEEVTYLANTGFQISDVEVPIGLEAGNYEVTGPIDELVTRPALLGGRWRRAGTYLFEVNWKTPTAAIDMLKGAVMNTANNGGKFKFEVMDERHKLNQTILRVVTNQCPRKHAACCVNIAPETETTVASVTDSLTLTVDDTITGADFINGRLWFTDGDLLGTDPIEIFAVSGSTITLFTEMPALPSPGDAVTLKEGCDGTREMCRDRFNNILEHRGFPDTGITDQILRMPIPGQGND